MSRREYLGEAVLALAFPSEAFARKPRRRTLYESRERPLSVYGRTGKWGSVRNPYHYRFINSRPALDALYSLWIGGSAQTFYLLPFGCITSIYAKQVELCGMYSGSHAVMFNIDALLNTFWIDYTREHTFDIADFRYQT